MEVDWERYQDSYPYRVRVSLHYLERQSKSLKHRVVAAVKRSLARNSAFLAGVFAVLWLLSALIAAVKRSLARNSAFLAGVFAVLWLLSAPGGTYGVAMVGVGATVLAWTAFRVHEKAFREAALVPDDRVGDTPYQERVSMTAMNYSDAAVGVLLVASGFAVRIVTSAA